MLIFEVVFSTDTGGNTFFSPIRNVYLTFAKAALQKSFNVQDKTTGILPILYFREEKTACHNFRVP